MGPVDEFPWFWSQHILFNHSPEAKHSFGRIMEILYGAKNGVHAFGYNSAKSEPILMKSGALLVHCWGLVLADFGREHHSVAGT